MSFTISGSAISCGVMQLSNFAAVSKDFKRELKNIYKQIYVFNGCNCADCVRDRKNKGETEPSRKGCTFVMFSDKASDPWERSRAFVKYLKEKNLGEVFEGPVQRNPNSGNDIVVWMWAIPELEDFKRILEIQ